MEFCVLRLWIKEWLAGSRERLHICGGKFKKTMSKCLDPYNISSFRESIFNIAEGLQDETDFEIFIYSLKIFTNLKFCYKTQ